MNGDGRIKNEKLREQQYKKEYGKTLERKIIKWDEVNDVKQLWEQVKQTVINNYVREVSERIKLNLQ